MIKALIKKILRGDKNNWGSLGEHSSVASDIRLFNERHIKIGEEASIGPGCYFGCWDAYAGIDLYPQLVIGDRFYARERLTILCAGNIKIGNAVTIAGGVLITNENHGLNPLTESYLDNPLECGDIHIGDGVWIGENVCVMPGVHIGNKAVIGAGSIVTKDIPAFTIACGSPCKVVKRWDGGQWVKTWEDGE